MQELEPQNIPSLELAEVDSERMRLATDKGNIELYKTYYQMRLADPPINAEEHEQFISEYNKLHSYFNVMLGKGIFFGGWTGQWDPHPYKRFKYNPEFHERIKIKGRKPALRGAKVGIVEPGVEIYSAKHRAVILAKKPRVMPIYM